MTDAPARRAPLTLALCFLGALAEGYDIQSMGVAAPTMAPALRLTHDQLGPAFSASTAGMIAGAILLGRLADRVGRRRVLIVSLTVFGALTLATAIAPNLPALLAIRLVAGLGLGGAMPNFLALAAEAVSEKRRGRAAAFAAAAMPFGGAIVSLLAAGLGWREIFVAGGLAPLAVAAAMVAALPESAAFLAARKAPSDAAPAANLAAVYFGEGRAAASLLLWTAAFAALFTLFVLLNWLPLLMGAKGFSKPEASLIQTLFNLGGVAGGFILSATFQAGRRAPILGLWFAGAAAALATLALARPDLLEAEAIGFMAGLYISSAPIALYALAPDYYAVAMRGAGVGATVGMGRIGATVGPLTASALLAAGGTTGALLALLPVVGVGASASLAVLRLKPGAQVELSPAAPESDPAPA